MSTISIIGVGSWNIAVHIDIGCELRRQFTQLTTVGLGDSGTG